jgi:hypothetical protein
MTDRNYKSQMDLEPNSFEIRNYWLLDNNDFYLYSKASGDLSIISDSLILIMNVAEMDTTAAFYEYYIPSGVLTRFERGTQSFNEIIQGSDDYRYKFEVNGNQLKLWHGSRLMLYNRIK